jgi:hypothetical protein
MTEIIGSKNLPHHVARLDDRGVDIFLTACKQDSYKKNISINYNV